MLCKKDKLIRSEHTAYIVQLPQSVGEWFPMKWLFTGWLAEKYGFQAGLIFAGVMDGLASVMVLPLIIQKAREKKQQSSSSETLENNHNSTITSNISQVSGLIFFALLINFIQGMPVKIGSL